MEYEILPGPSVARDMAARLTACAVALRSVEFGGAGPAEVPASIRSVLTCRCGS